MTGSSTPSGLQWIEGKFGSGHWCEGKTCLICGGTPASENDAGELRETIEADAFHAMRAFCEDTDNVEFQPRLLGLVDNLLERAFAALRQNRPERPSTTALPPLGAPVQPFDKPLPLERLKTEAERWIPAIASGELPQSAAAHDLRDIVQRAHDLGFARSATRAIVSTKPLAEIIEIAEDTNYRDEFVGNVVRASLSLLKPIASSDSRGGAGD